MNPTPGIGHYTHGRYEAVSLNSGTFYVRSTAAGRRAIQRTADLVQAEPVWDQEAFTTVMMRPSFLEYEVLHRCSCCLHKLRDGQCLQPICICLSMCAELPSYVDQRDVSAAS